MIVGIIPARYASTRLPGKPLIDLEGQTMIERVWRAAMAASTFDRVVIATDSEHIVAEAQRIRAEVVLTSPDEPSGTDRCYAAIRALKIAPDVIVNIQGDEPLLQPNVLTHCVEALRSQGADVATPVKRISSVLDLADPNVVKVALTATGRALYFSRSQIPHLRGVEVAQWLATGVYWKHIGLYAYTAESLKQHVMLPPSPLERMEHLEQLRLLEYGAHITCVEIEHDAVSVDTADDVERVRAILRADLA
ncbi:MAG: 3-deoxy-manno-octulosonate cytidylyltransferase [Ignavibacteria bacterium]|nr:3-deoxy-manno-octulosonate cytidylyltransferase [Ignavibacteria bacterium]